MIRIMEMFHWSYGTFKETPPFVLSNIINYLESEQEVRKQNEKRQNQIK
jgi:hypothetical protein